MTTRWQQGKGPRGDDYDARWRSLAASGENIHGEADLVSALLTERPLPTERPGGAVLDAGCGTGRVAIELARRGFVVVGIDVDAGMLDTARAKAPGLTWTLADLAADLSGPSEPAGPFDLVLLAGNVMIFLEPGTERHVLANLTRRLAPGGLLVAGFSLHPQGLTIDGYDALAAAEGLLPVHRWATWDREPYTGGDYAVSVHRREDGV